jgi:DNA polymerase-3 subunit gamma/tau
VARTRKVKSEAQTSSPDYTVLARRYRPQQFGDLVGQEPVAQALINALQTNRVAHAYLFTGARGVGKTSTARILAKALNCEKGPTATPCDACEMCRSIASGEDIDVLEIDGASNRGIDNIREVRGNVQYRPSRGRYKIYIIDEVHMLSKDAFNALLKTLEEPPPHVKFIFATTEVQKVPLTVLSRCQRFDFAGIGTQRIVERLAQIVAGEGMQADPDALALVARRAGGSMRDAQSLLDQLLAFGGERLTTPDVHALLGTANDDRVAELAGAVLNHDPRTALDLLGRAADTGLQLGELLDQLIDYWRDLMVVKSGGDGLLLNATGSHGEEVKQRAAGLTLDTILAGLDVLVSTKYRSRASNHGRVLLEMALVRLGRLDDLVSVAQLTQWLKQGEGAPPGQRQAGPHKSSVGSATPLRSAEPVQAPEAAKKKSINGVETSSSAATPLPLTPQALADVWSNVLTQVGPMLANDLGKAEDVAISGPNTLVLRFSARYNLQREHCQEPVRVARVEEALRVVTGQVCSVRIESGGIDRQPSASPEQGNEAPEASPSRSRRLRNETMQRPLIKRAIEVMGAQVVQIDEDFGTVPADSPDRGEPAGIEES